MGKGDKQRPAFVPGALISTNWCATFGHKLRDSTDVCINCGAMMKGVVDGQVSGLVQAPTGRQRRTKRNVKE